MSSQNDNLQLVSREIITRKGTGAGGDFTETQTIERYLQPGEEQEAARDAELMRLVRQAVRAELVRCGQANE